MGSGGSMETGSTRRGGNDQLSDLTSKWSPEYECSKIQSRRADQEEDAREIRYTGLPASLPGQQKERLWFGTSAQFTEPEERQRMGKMEGKKGEQERELEQVEVIMRQ